MYYEWIMKKVISSKSLNDALLLPWASLKKIKKLWILVKIPPNFMKFRTMMPHLHLAECGDWGQCPMPNIASKDAYANKCG